MTIPGTSRGLAPTRQQLSNGAVVIAKEARATPAVTIHASIEAGGICDPPDVPGVSNFVSRLIDRGTASRSADGIAEELDNRGVSLSVNVNRHVLSVILTCLTEDVDDMLALLGDIVMQPTFPADEVSIRRNEIITMIRQDDDNPAAQAMQRLLALVYGRHPYGWLPRGTVESVEQIERDALAAFHRRWFVPGAFSLAIVGDIDAPHAIAGAERVFGAWTGAPFVAPRLPAVDAPSARRQIVHPMMNKAQADIAYGFTAVVRADPQYYAYWLMNNVLGQYALGGRLGDSIRERQGMAYYVVSALDANRAPGPLVVRAGVNPSNVDRAIDSIDAELVRMADGGPTERELQESKQFLTGSMPRNLETNAGIAMFLQTAEFFDLGLDYDLRMPGLLNRVTRDEVHEAARRTLDPSRASVVVAGPYDRPGQ